MLCNMQQGDYAQVIFDRGCLRSGEEWVEKNLIPVAGVAVALAVLQVLGGCSRAGVYKKRERFEKTHRASTQKVACTHGNE